MDRGVSGTLYRSLSLCTTDDGLESKVVFAHTGPCSSTEFDLEAGSLDNWDEDHRLGLSDEYDDFSDGSEYFEEVAALESRELDRSRGVYEDEYRHAMFLKKNRKNVGLV